jgi:hypothetical protein
MKATVQIFIRAIVKLILVMILAIIFKTIDSLSALETELNNQEQYRTFNKSYPGKK